MMKIWLLKAKVTVGFDIYEGFTIRAAARGEPGSWLPIMPATFAGRIRSGRLANW